MKLKSTLTAVGVLALMLSTAGLNPAFADSGKAKPKANSHSTSNGNSSSHVKNQPTKAVKSATTHGNGVLASELKGLNAVKANPNALEHASPNSQVGRIATYRDAALATAGVATILADAQADLALLPVPDRTVGEINDDIAATDIAIAAVLLLDPADPINIAALAALQADRTLLVGEVELTVAQNLAIADAQAVVDTAADNLDAAQGLEDDALLVASNGRTLSDEAIAYIRATLGL